MISSQYISSNSINKNENNNEKKIDNDTSLDLSQLDSFNKQTMQLLENL